MRTGLSSAWRGSRTKCTVYPVSFHCKLRQKAITRLDASIVEAQDSHQILGTSSLVSSLGIILSKTNPEKKRLVHSTHRGSEETSWADSQLPAAKPGHCPHLKLRNTSTCTVFQAEDIPSSSDSLFINKLQKTTNVDHGEHPWEAKECWELKGLCSRPLKKSYYTEVLEMWTKTPAPPSH